jgi:hypothetical protein
MWISSVAASYELERFLMETSSGPGYQVKIITRGFWLALLSFLIISYMRILPASIKNED